MSINRLSKCKTLNDFNYFSKNIKTDAKSGGRSFIYTDSKGKTHSYMNQIVHRFDKCIKKSKQTANTNLCAEVNAGLDAIDQWNQDADAKAKTCMLGFRKWLGNGWYSLFHKHPKDQTLADIKAAYPKTFVTCTAQIPQDILNIMIPMLEGNELDRAHFAGANKACYERVQKIEVENEALVNKYGIFGKRQWQALGVEIGNVPTLPQKIEDLMESDCPIWEGKKTKDTHRLVLIPATVNNKPFTLKNMVEIALQFVSPAIVTEARDMIPGIQDQIEHNSSDRSYWVLMTKECIPINDLPPFFGDKSYHRYWKTEAIYPSINGPIKYDAVLAREMVALALVESFDDHYLLEHRVGCQELIDGEQVGLLNLYGDMSFSAGGSGNFFINHAARRNF